MKYEGKVSKEEVLIKIVGWFVGSIKRGFEESLFHRDNLILDTTG